MLVMSKTQEGFIFMVPGMEVRVDSLPHHVIVVLVIVALLAQSQQLSHLQLLAERSQHTFLNIRQQNTSQDQISTASYDCCYDCALK
jgi:hypothetical protein